MAKKSDRLQLLDAIAEERGYHTGIFLTYGADLAFFEEAILRVLWENGCRSNLILMDANRYNDTLTDFRGSVSWPGCRYLVRPVDLGPLQSFHPKVVLLVGMEHGRLMIGSGNLTFTGFGHNHEVYTCVDWAPDQPFFHAVFTQMWKLITAIDERWGYSKEVGLMLRKAETVAPWLIAPAEESGDTRLVHTLQEPLLDQLVRALEGTTVDRLTMVTPFLDEGAVCLQQMAQRTKPKEIRLVLQHRRAVGNAQDLKRLMQEGLPLAVYRFADDDSYLHAKLYLFETPRGAYLLSGSPNCTRSAMLHSSSNGNLEIALLRRASSSSYFERLIESRMSREPIENIDDLEIERSPVSQPKREPGKSQLLDVSLAGGFVSGVVSMGELPEEVAELQLRLRSTRTNWVPLGELRPNMTEFTRSLPSELLAWLKGPVSASLWGRTTEGDAVDLRCNELWATNVDILRHEISRASPIHAQAGVYLSEMLVASDEEWRDLYEALSRLIELDVAGLQRRGGTYTTSPPVRLPPPDEGELELEDTVVLVSEDEEIFRQRSEIADALFHESAVYALIDLVRGALPGASRVIEASGGLATEDTAEGTAARRKQPPSAGLGRKFVNLVRKYVRSLMNPAYMLVASTYHILAHYALFHRIVVLLREHEVISPEDCVRFACDINVGFFGSRGDDAPALLPRLRRHFQHALADEWLEAEVPAYALGSALAGGLTSSPRPLQDDVVLAELSIRVMAALAIVVDLPQAAEDSAQLAPAAQLYADDLPTFQWQICDCVGASLPEVQDLLERWFNQCLAAIEDAASPLDRAILYRAALDCGRGAYEVAACQKIEETMRRWCSDLIFWARLAGDREIAREWRETLVGILEESGEPQELAQELLGEGIQLFFAKQYQESIHKLSQARLLAERVGDEELVNSCQQWLTNSEVLLGLQGSQ